MSNLLKDVYSPEFYADFSEILSQSISSFDKDKFIEFIFNDEFSTYELKQRMTHTANVLSYFLPDDFTKATRTLTRIIKNLRKAEYREDGFEFMFFPEYIALYGMDDYDTAIPALEFITQFASCEFAVRPFILKYENKMLKQMLDWSKHKHPSVRRLASEGSRPRLPWAMGLPKLKNDPSPILPILENLKQDSSETVRRSVANNLNDISKDNPKFVIDIVKQWRGMSIETDALLKHACRTLLKQGNPVVLKLFGFESKSVELAGFKLNTPRVRIGHDLEFAFTINNRKRKKQTVRLEYGLYYLKQNGQRSKKVFKISEREIEANSQYEIARKQSFRLITTRKYYTGVHQLSIIINGQESALHTFELIA